MSKNIKAKLDMPAETAAIIYRANGGIERINPKEGSYFTIKELQEIVGGKIEAMTLLKKYNIIFNEKTISPELVPNLTFPQFYGDVVICKPDSW
jgi:hypothetical protein